MIGWMDKELLLGVVQVVLDSNQKLNLLNMIDLQCHNVQLKDHFDLQHHKVQ